MARNGMALRGEPLWLLDLSEMAVNFADEGSAPARQLGCDDIQDGVELRALGAHAANVDRYDAEGGTACGGAPLRFVVVHIVAEPVYLSRLGTLPELSFTPGDRPIALRRRHPATNAAPFDGTLARNHN